MKKQNERSEIYSPAYFKEFKCTAQNCTHCCCIGWEIDVDEDTAAKYASMQNGYGKRINESVVWCDQPHFALTDEGRCPHLDESGLCRIINEYGEGCLCDICREHPRFYNETDCATEAGIGMSCEEACRLILSSDGYADIRDPEGIALPLPDADGFSATRERNGIFRLLSDESHSYEEKIMLLSARYDIDKDMLSEESVCRILGSLEYLDESHRKLLLKYKRLCETSADIERPLCRALAYFIYRHCSESISADELRACVGLCLFLGVLLRSLASEAGACDVRSLILPCRIISEEIEYSTLNTESIKTEFWF